MKTYEAMMRILGIVLLLASLAIEPVANGQRKHARFIPPDIRFASGITYPVEGVAGMVGLLVTLDGSGQVQYVQVRRDILSLTPSALVAIDDWVFRPAKRNGKPWAANLSVNILFNPDLQLQGVPLPPAEAPERSQETGFMPPELLAASFAAYPRKSLDGGTVVLDVTISNTGRVKGVSVIRRSASFTRTAVAAVKRWSFKPGTFEGLPIASKTIVAFVFRSPAFAVADPLVQTRGTNTSWPSGSMSKDIELPRTKARLNLKIGNGNFISGGIHLSSFHWF